MNNELTIFSIDGYSSLSEYGSLFVIAAKNMAEAIEFVKVRLANGSVARWGYNIRDIGTAKAGTEPGVISEFIA